MIQEKIPHYPVLESELAKRGITKKEIAKATGLALSTINGFMGGKRYSALAEKKIREFLRISKKFSKRKE